MPWELRAAEIAGRIMMPPSNSKIQQPKFLSSWKEIANYMGKGVRTVQRYEAQLGLPVRRPAGKPHAAVVATRAEIDAWIAASLIRETFRLPPALDFRRDPELATLKNGIREMHLLRQQMSELRAEQHLSLKLLVSGLRSLRQKSSDQVIQSEDILDAALRNSTRFSFQRPKRSDPEA